MKLLFTHFIDTAKISSQGTIMKNKIPNRQRQTRVKYIQFTSITYSLTFPLLNVIRKISSNGTCFIINFYFYYTAKIYSPINNSTQKLYQGITDLLSN